MHVARRSVILFTIATASCGWAHTGDQIHGLSELERSLLSYRRDHIRSVRAVCEVSKSFALDPRVAANGQRKLILWSCPSGLRCEELGSGGNLVRTTVETGNVTLTQGLSTKPKGEVHTGTLQVYRDGTSQINLPDIRQVGLDSTCFAILHKLRTHQFDELLSNRNKGRTRSDPIGVAGTDGESLTRIDYQDTDGDIGEIWIDSSRGPSVVKVVHTASAKGRKVVDSLDVTVVDNDGIWFPQKLVHRRTVGDAPPYVETVVLSDVTLNADFDVSLFNVEGFGLAPGSSVIMSPSEGKPWIWDGADLVERATTIVREELRPAPKSSWTSWLIRLNVVVVVVLVLTYLRRSATRR
jgi:hypothetical protein